jgi:hypothetical protein
LADPSLLAGTILFADAQCAIAFSYPSGWEVLPAELEGEPPYPCLFGLRPPDWQSISEENGVCLREFAIYISAAPLAPQDALRESPLSAFVPFRFEAGQWSVYDLVFEDMQLPVVVTPDLFIVRAILNTPIYRDCLLGGRAGLSGAHVLLLSDGHSTAIVDTDPYAPFIALEAVISSFSFTRDPE